MRITHRPRVRIGHTLMGSTGAPPSGEGLAHTTGNARLEIRDWAHLIYDQGRQYMVGTNGNTEEKTSKTGLRDRRHSQLPHTG